VSVNFDVTIKGFLKFDVTADASKVMTQARAEMQAARTKL
jgi:hypothetical protein